MGVRQRARGTHGRSARLPHRHDRGHQRRLRRVHRRRRLPGTAPLVRRGLGVAPRRARRSAIDVAAERRRLRAAAVRPHRGDPGGRAGPARLLLRGRGVRELGGPPPPERGRVGEGSDLDAAGREARAALGRRASCRPREHRARALRAGTRGRLSGGRQPMGLPRDARRRLGVDVFSLHRLSRLLGVPLPRVLRGVLRRRLPRPARRLVGDAPLRRAGNVPQLGLPQRRQIFSGFRTARDA